MLKNKNVEELMSRSRYDFSDLCLILEILRGEGGCPWDAEQTHRSIRKNFIEETYEVIEAIDNDDKKLLREELGDVLLQVVFHAQMEKELGTFDINDVSNDVCAKLIHRHPHIFGDVSAESTEEVLNNWEAIKNEEKSRVTLYDKLSSIPPMTPSLMRAAKISKKSGEYKERSTSDILSEASAILERMSDDCASVSEADIGELLFALCAASEKLDIDPEEALFKKTNVFVQSYKQDEEQSPVAP